MGSPSALCALPAKEKSPGLRPLPMEPPVMVMSAFGAPMSPQPAMGGWAVEGMRVPPVRTILKAELSAGMQAAPNPLPWSPPLEMT